MKTIVNQSFEFVLDDGEVVKTTADSEYQAMMNVLILNLPNNLVDMLAQMLETTMEAGVVKGRRQMAQEVKEVMKNHPIKDVTKYGLEN